MAISTHRLEEDILEEHRAEAPRRPARAGAGRLAQGAGWLALGYLLALAAAEALTVLVEPRLGLALHGLVLVALFLHAALGSRGARQRFLLSLALAPLVRLVSLSMPLAGYSLQYWYLVIGVPLFAAAFVAARAGRLSRGMLGLRVGSLPVQLLIGTLGLGLGYVEYLILRPEPLLPAFSWDATWLTALILLVFTGFLEELVFRGLMQYAAIRLMSWPGLLYVAAVFTVLHFGYRSMVDLAFVFGVAVFLGVVALYSGSILGVSLAHGLINISLYLVIPFLLGPAAAGAPGSPPLAQPTAPALGAPTPAGATARPPTPSPFASAPTLPATHPPAASPSPATWLAPVHSMVVVDDGDPGFSLIQGVRWQAEQGIGGDLLWAFTTAGEATLRVEWRPELQVCGNYEVWVYVPAAYATSRAASYEIGHRWGTHTALLDQSTHPGEWVSLGVYEFLPSAGSYLAATDATGEAASPEVFIAFDAALWNYTGPCSQPPAP